MFLDSFGRFKASSIGGRCPRSNGGGSHHRGHGADGDASMGAWRSWKHPLPETNISHPKALLSR